MGERRDPAQPFPLIESLLRKAELRLRGRMGRAEFERLRASGESIDLRTAVDHALQGALS
ncbi:hypothetical protein ACFQX6_35450 [Streptosporangium lutulentum]